MKIVIPAKCNSTRVPNKNWRDFYEGLSLVEIKIQQLLDAGSNASDIWIFCEDESKKELIEPYGVNFSNRRDETISDSMHWSDVITELVGKVPCDDDETVALVLPTTPLFDSNDFRAVFHLWEKRQGPLWDESYDSLIVVKPFQEFILNEDGKPLNFSFGRWHEWSQDLPQWFVLDNPVSLIKKRTLVRCNYTIGVKPYLYVVSRGHIDIDSMDEFEISQQIYKSRVL